MYLRRNDGDALTLTIEHRAAPSADGVDLGLHADGDALALRVREQTQKEPPATTTTVERVEHVLGAATRPMAQRETRDLAKMRAASVSDALATLVTDGRITRVLATSSYADSSWGEGLGLRQAEDAARPRERPRPPPEEARETMAHARHASRAAALQRPGLPVGEPTGVSLLELAEERHRLQHARPSPPPSPASFLRSFWLSTA